LYIPPCGSGKLTAGIHVTITIVLYFGVELQVLFDNIIGSVSIAPAAIEPVCIEPDKIESITDRYGFMHILGRLAAY